MDVRVSLALTALAVGCGYDEEYTGMGQGALAPAEPPCVCECRGEGEGEGEGEGGDTGTLDAADLAGRLYRFTALALTAPLQGQMADLLNGYFTGEIDADRLHVLLLVTGDDRASGRLTLSVGPGEGADGVYVLGDASSTLACELEGATFSTSEPARLDFPNDLLVPPALPIERLELSGRPDPPGEAVGGGVLVGALTGEDAAAITLGGTDFATFLGGLGVTPDLDLDGDAEPDAWRFEGTWAAARVRAAGEGGQ